MRIKMKEGDDDDDDDDDEGMNMKNVQSRAYSFSSFSMNRILVDLLKMFAITHIPTPSGPACLTHGHNKKSVALHSVLLASSNNAGARERT